MMPVPMNWPTGEAYEGVAESVPTSIKFGEVFRDPRLIQLIEIALKSNLDLQIALENIEIARSQYRIQRSDRLPKVELTSRATRGDEGAGASLGAAEVYSVDLGVSAFELDLFGRVKSLSGASLNRYLATEAGGRATQIALVSEVASAWLRYAADRSLIRVAEDTATNGLRSVQLTTARLEQGVAPRSDVRQAEIILSQARVDLASSKTALARDLNLLNLLVGTTVDLALLPDSIEQVTESVSALPAGLDSTVLLRRPDVMQAEYQLRASNADIGAARAALFPRVSLTALVGYASSASGALFTDAASSATRSATLSLPIFLAGAGRAGLDQVHSQRAVAVSTYERAIQTAFREVADALARRGTILDEESAQRSLLEAAVDNFQISDERYRGGIESFLQSLDSQRALYSAQRGLVETQFARTSNLVNLYRVLGGDSPQSE